MFILISVPVAIFSSLVFGLNEYQHRYLNHNKHVFLTLPFIFMSLYPNNQDVVTCEGSRLLLQISMHTHIQKYTL